MNKPRRLCMVLALVVSAFVTLAAAHPDEAPRALLDKLVATELAARTFQMSADWKVGMSFLGQQLEMGLRSEIAYQQPNLFRARFAESEMGEDGKPKPGDFVLAVCDGKQFFVDATKDGKRRIVVAPAPPDLLKMKLNEVVGMGSNGQESPEGEVSIPDFLSVHDGTFDLAKVKSVTADFDRNDAWLKALKEPADCVAITVQLMTGPPYVLWIDPRDFTLRQVALALSAADQPAKPGEAEGAAGALAEMFKTMSMHMLITADKVVYDEPIAADSFVYTPPAGVKVITVKSVADISAALEPPKPLVGPTEEGPPLPPGSPTPGATKPHPQTEAWKMLDEVVATYRSAKTYIEEGWTYDEAIGPRTHSLWERRYKIVYEAPNLLYTQSGDIDDFRLFVCDGKNFWARLSHSVRVGKAPAPADLRHNSSLALVAPYSGPFVTAPRVPPTFLQCLAQNFDVGEVKAVHEGLPAGRPWIASLKRPAGTMPITVVWAQEPPMVLWVDRREHVIRQWAIEATSRELMTAYSGSLRPYYAEGGTARWVVRTDRAAVDRPVPAAAFAFRLPAGATVVQATSPDKLIARVYGGDESPSGPEQEEPSPPTEAEKSFEGKEPIDFTAVDLDGKPVALSSFKGKPVVVDFWATWCPPCRAELPLLEEAYAKLKAQGLEVVAVAVDETVVDVQKFLTDNKLSFTVLWLDGSTPEGKKVSADYGITAIPRTLYIAPDWVIKSDTTGLHEKAAIYKALASIGLKTD